MGRATGKSAVKGVAKMPTYVVLYKFTDEGAKNIKSTLQRARESRA